MERNVTDQAGPHNRAEAVTLIFTNLTTVGEGRGKHDPVRRVEEFWTEEGRLVARNDPFDYSLYFRQSIEAAHYNYRDIIANILGVPFTEENPGGLVTGLVDTAIELKQDVEMLLKDKVHLEQENISLREEIMKLREHLSPTATSTTAPEPTGAALDVPAGALHKEDRIIFALSKGVGKDEIIAVFQSDGKKESSEQLWGVILKVLSDTCHSGENPAPERFNLPADFLSGVYKTVYGYIGHFVNGELDCVSPYLFEKQL